MFSKGNCDNAAFVGPGVSMPAAPFSTTEPAYVRGLAESKFPGSLKCLRSELRSVSSVVSSVDHFSTLIYVKVCMNSQLNQLIGPANFFLPVTHFIVSRRF